MHRLLVVNFSLVVCWVGMSGELVAQTIQQPVVQTFGATTTLSVPDRGTAFIGGVGQSAYGYRRAGFGPLRGPLRGPSNFGRASSGASMSATVTIHDFQAMDEYLLQSAPRSTNFGPALQGVAANAFEELTETRLRPNGQDPSSRTIAQPSPATSRAERFFQLGLAAESRGQTGVARLHFQTAVRLGSTSAADHLRENSKAR